MTHLLNRIFGGATASLRGRVVGIYVVLIAANLAAWLWALTAFHGVPVLLGTALLAYGFGLRHAVDADHIAAIDNVTRKLMQDGQKPVTVGFFFALGHSTVVALASFVIAAASSALSDRFTGLKEVGGVIGTSVSALFLLTIAVMNIFILRGVYRAFKRVRDGGIYVEEDFDMLMSQGGIMARLFRPLFAMMTSPWLMYPLGFLFGLGFETATEVALLGMSAEGASQGLPLSSILVFPALFTAGMTLIDTTDGVLMLGAYGWAFLKPIRKIYYNMTITFVSVIVAVLVGGVEALGLIGEQFAFSGAFWDAIDALNGSFGSLGYLIIGIFAASWVISAVIYRVKGYDGFEVKAAGE
jgi:high-affinity nickel-transport protein